MFHLVAAFPFLPVALQAHAAPTEAPTIDWRVKHPFRYFIEIKEFDVHREAVAEVIQASSGALIASLFRTFRSL